MRAHAEQCRATEPGTLQFEILLPEEMSLEEQVRIQPGPWHDIRISNPVGSRRNFRRVFPDKESKWVKSCNFRSLPLTGNRPA